MRRLPLDVLASGFILALAGPLSAQSTPKDAVVVHLDADESAVLQIWKTDSWVDICSAPCDRPLSPSGRYRLNGSGVRHSDSFVLLAEAGAGETIHADTRSSGMFVGGIVILGVGVVGVLAGLATTSFGVIAKTCSSESGAGGGGCSRANPELVGLGIGIIIPSAIAVVGGIALMASNGRSTVSQSAAAEFRRGLHRDAPVVSFPLLHSEIAAHRDSAIVPGAMTTPIFTFSF